MRSASFDDGNCRRLGRGQNDGALDTDAPIGLTDSRLSGAVLLSPRESMAWALPGDARATAAWDPDGKLLQLRRDAPGRIPMYTAIGTQGVWVGDSAAGVAQQLDRNLTLNKRRIADALVDHFQWVDPSATFYNEVVRVPAGGWTRIIPRTGSISSGQDWQPCPEDLSGVSTPDALGEMLVAVLRGAISRMIADTDGNVGVMLSGGLDSAYVAALASRSVADAGRSLATASVINGADVECRESDAIHNVAAMPGLSPTILDLACMSPGDRTMLTDHLLTGSEPWDGTLSLMRWVYHALSRRGAVWVLDGIDADSLLDEGDVSVAIARQLRSGSFGEVCRSAIGLVQHWGSVRLVPGVLATAAKLAFIPARLRQRIVRRRPTPQVASPTERLRALIADSAISLEFAREVDLLDREAQYARESATQGVANLRSPSIGAERYHRAAAGSGVTPLHPFMDAKVIDFCLGLPSAARFSKGWSKWLMRQASEGLLPEKVRWRRGKEHLGWRLTRQLIEGLQPSLPARLATLRDALSPFVRATTLERLSKPDALKEEDLAQSLELVSLGTWLTRHSGIHGYC